MITPKIGYLGQPHVFYYYYYFRRSAERAGFVFKPISNDLPKSLKIARVCPIEGQCPQNTNRYYLFTDISLDTVIKLFSDYGLPEPDRSLAELIHSKHSGLTVYRLPSRKP